MEPVEPDILENLAIDTLMLLVLEWQCIEDLSVKETQLRELKKYFQCLPQHMCDEILEFLIESDDILRLKAEHIALFVRDNTKELTLPDHLVDFGHLLYFCGPKLKNLEELSLFAECHIDYVLCREMCELMPNLHVLYLSSCHVDEDAIVFIANLPLVEFYPGHSISEFGIEVLCRLDSKAKETLRVFQIGEYGLPPRCYHKVLESMKMIEDFGNADSKWFSSLPYELQNREFNLKDLIFDSNIDLVEKELEIVMMTCPKLTDVTIRSQIYTPRVICGLTTFKKLASLRIIVLSNLDLNVEDKSQLCERICLNNATFPSLTKLTLTDEEDTWISNGYLFRILEMCPHLDTLELMYCDGFSNKIAAELSRLVLNGNLKHLLIQFCDLLGPSGVGDLLRIPSLNELRVFLSTTEVVKQHFDSHPLHDDAKKYNVNLILEIFVDDVPMIVANF